MGTPPNRILERTNTTGSDVRRGRVLHTKVGKEQIMAHCTQMKKDDVYVCETCGLQVKVVQECGCADPSSGGSPCPPDSVLSCCGKELKAK